ncbi:14678_t:CDS:2 [Dentiscutata erythropus]|uniref:14678_t:CDS:1 n=1 Tax=Dentiscutata erythropus TaxID=1348616 RepID=A0A9N9BQ21_9GLOM|nr:14678_t:CDS:2 [Dentiscutata erythropus]
MSLNTKSYCLFIGQSIHNSLLLSESYPNITSAELGHSFPYALLGSFAVLLAISFVYSTPSVEIEDNIDLNFLMPNKKLLDIIGFTLAVQPFWTWFPLSILTGIHADLGDTTFASNLFTAQYSAWAIWCCLYLISLCFIWRRLNSVIKYQIKELKSRLRSGLEDADSELERLERGKRNIYFPMSCIISGIMIQVIFLAAILALVHTSEATCANKAVYDDCNSRGQTQLNACYAKPNDYPCQCTAMTAIRNCYRQCPDDTDITSQGNAYQTSVDQVCSYANQQLTASSAPAPTQPTMAPAGPTAPTTPSNPSNPSNPPASSGSPSNQPTKSDTPSGTKSSANSNNNGRQIFFAAVLSIVVLIMAF